MKQKDSINEVRDILHDVVEYLEEVEKKLFADDYTHTSKELRMLGRLKWRLKQLRIDE